jgi:hypothetical protein
MDQNAIVQFIATTLPGVDADVESKGSGAPEIPEHGVDEGAGRL